MFTGCACSFHETHQSLPDRAPDLLGSTDKSQLLPYLPLARLVDRLVALVVFIIVVITIVSIVAPYYVPFAIGQPIPAVSSNEWADVCAGTFLCRDVAKSCAYARQERVRQNLALTAHLLETLPSSIRKDPTSPLHSPFQTIRRPLAVTRKPLRSSSRDYSSCTTLTAERQIRIELELRRFQRGRASSLRSFTASTTSLNMERNDTLVRNEFRSTHSQLVAEPEDGRHLTECEVVRSVPGSTSANTGLRCTQTPEKQRYGSLRAVTDRAVEATTFLLFSTVPGRFNTRAC